MIVFNLLIVHPSLNNLTARWNQYHTNVGWVTMQFFTTACSLDGLISVCFYKFMSSNHLILFCSNKTAFGAIKAGKDCNKVYMLTGLCPGTAEKGRQLHKHSKCQQSCLWDFQLFVLRRLQADRVNYLWQNSPLLPPLQKEKENMKVKLSSVKL